MAKPPLPQWANQYRKAAFKDGHAGPHLFDCYRLNAVTARTHFGWDVDLHRELAADETLNDQAYREDIARQFEDRSNWKKVERPRFGDWVLLQIGGVDCHLGVAVSVWPRAPHLEPAGEMMHIHKGINVTIEPWHEGKWRKRISGFYTWTGPMIEGWTP